jgi:hypothetical protein
MAQSAEYCWIQKQPRAVVSYRVRHCVYVSGKYCGVAHRMLKPASLRRTDPGRT